MNRALRLLLALGLCALAACRCPEGMKAIPDDETSEALLIGTEQ